MRTATHVRVDTVATSSEINAVVFDMDGVLFEGRNFWLDLHHRYGTEVEGVDAAERYMASNYATLAELVVGELWRGRSAAPFLELIRERRYQPGVRAVVAGLQARGISTVIVSSGPELLALRAQRDLGFDIVRANAVEIRNGRLTGASTIHVPDGAKELVGLSVLANLHVPAGRAASIGDTGSDVPLARRVGMAIAYDSASADLDEAADYHLRHGQLTRLLSLVDRSAARLKQQT
jgi:phosphoserine phosphatase